MKIRLGKKGDSSAIKAIDSSIGSDPNRAEYIDLSLRQNTVRIAHENGEIIGYSVVNHSFFRRPTLEMLMVVEARRRQGVGRALLREAQARMCTNGELWTSTNASNKSMRSLLKSEGFEISGRIENLDPGDSELVYFKEFIET